ncbi:hypothetical protein [Hasllibacter sp. MH4015]|uniref:hypothetical protein n=1 Tax=Hasllibacter sp. MH4015 TaxID=2854029 RepID=UPI001CD5E3F4|nr:hypothetical protein [Hasllibacter sp. MH4015]
MSKSPLIPITLGLLSLAGIAWLFWSIFATQRDDVSVARAFLTHVAAGDHAEARALMSPALAVQLPTTRMAAEFGDIEPWDRLAFPQRNSNTSNGIRRTEIYGTGHAVSGCESDLVIVLIDGLVDAFNVTPLCPAIGVDA